MTLNFKKESNLIVESQDHSPRNRHHNLCYSKGSGKIVQTRTLRSHCQFQAQSQAEIEKLSPNRPKIG